jgi:hypothetical protein
MGHSGWAGHTAVGYGGLACRRSTWRFVASRRGPRRLTSEPVGAHERHLNHRGPQLMDVKSANFQTVVYFCKMIFKKYKKSLVKDDERSRSPSPSCSHPLLPLLPPTILPFLLALR